MNQLSLFGGVVAMYQSDDDFIPVNDSTGEFRRGDCFQDDNGNYYCDENSIQKCIETGAILPVDEMIQDEHGQWWSEDAYNENHICCENCCDSVSIDDYVSSDDGQCFCSPCHNDLFTNCDDCNCEVDRDSSHYVDGHGEYCESCFCDSFAGCEGCYESFHMDDLYSSRDGYFCSECRCQDEWEQDFSWRGCDAYDKIGSNRKFGIELETSDCDGYQDWAQGYKWGAKSDGSISGMEFVSPPLRGNDGLKSIFDLVGKLEQNADVNDDCGFHLHIDLADCDDNELQAIALAYHYTRKFWSNCITEERRDTYYARYSTDSKQTDQNCFDYDSIMQSPGIPLTQGSRYCWCNWRAYRSHKTVEIRSHEATVDPVVVANWVKAHTMFVDYVKGMTIGGVKRVFGSEDVVTIMREMRHIWCDDDLADFYGCKMKLSEMIAA